VIDDVARVLEHLFKGGLSEDLNELEIPYPGPSNAVIIE
jgi:hypothetical protein